MKRCLILFLVTGHVSNVSAGIPFMNNMDTVSRPGNYARYIQSGGLHRSYIVHILRNYTSEKSMPLV